MAVTETKPTATVEEVVIKQPTFIHVNEGNKVNLGIDGNIISINGDELVINLAKKERDQDVTIDISEDSTGGLTMGVSRKYVMQIFIPARMYSVKPNPDAPVPKEGEIDITGIQMDSYIRVAEPFDISRVIIKLWAL